jgi:hypothetical protein
MGGWSHFKVPAGWVARGWWFEAEITIPAQRALIAQHFGARRFAYNWALAQVKANLDARAADASVPPLGWSLPTLRKAWNQAKTEVAPWWPSCSKEAYASGITDLVAALHGWSASKQGRRAGARVGFPRFKSRRHDRGRVRFTTGAMRLEPDRRHLTLPVVGRLRSKENTRRLQRLLAKGQARVLSMTLSEQGGRLFVSVATVVAQAPRRPTQPDARCGIDLGIGAEWAVVAHANDTIEPDHSSRAVGCDPIRASPGRPAGIAPHCRIPRTPPGESQAGGPGPTCGQPASRIHPRSHDGPGPPLRHDRGRGSGCWRDGQGHGPALVPAQRAPGRARPGASHPGL